MYTVSLCLADSLYLISEAIYWLNDGNNGAPTGMDILLVINFIAGSISFNCFSSKHLCMQMISCFQAGQSWMKIRHCAEQPTICAAAVKPGQLFWRFCWPWNVTFASRILSRRRCALQSWPLCPLRAPSCFPLFYPFQLSNTMSFTTIFHFAWQIQQKQNFMTPTTWSPLEFSGKELLGLWSWSSLVLSFVVSFKPEKEADRWEQLLELKNLAQPKIVKLTTCCWL